MLNKNFEKILNLSKKTGDKFIVLPEFGDPLVIVPLREYEKILNYTPDVKNLTEEELLDRINRDVAIWKDSQTDFENEWSADAFSLTDNDPEDELEDEKNLENNLAEKINYEPLKPWLDDENAELEKPKKYDFDSTEEIADLSEWATENEQYFEEKKDTLPQESTTIKYEDIPPPPDLSPSAVILDRPTPIIDLSFEDGNKGEEETETEDEFTEEPVY